MKILQINNCHFRRGGADVVYLNTGRMLEGRGHNVQYLSQKNIKNELIGNQKYFVNEIDYFSKSLTKRIFNVIRFFYSLESAKKLSLLLNEKKPDIAHIHLYKGTLTPSILFILKKNKIPTLITLHDYGFLCPHNLFLDGKGSPCNKCIDSPKINSIRNKCNRNNILFSFISFLEYKYHEYFFPFNKYFDKIVTVSKFALREHKKSKELNNKLLHLYNFFPFIEKTIQNSVKGNYFLFYGRLSKEKGIISLLRSWHNANIKNELKIAGSGPLLDEINDYLKYNNINNVQILGFKQGKELENLISNASFIIVPSEWYENNPLTIIEAYAYGKPVIGASIGGITEIINDEKTGYIFEAFNHKALSDALLKANELSRENYTIMSNHARKFAEDNFSEDAHYENLISIYNKTITECKKV